MARTSTDRLARAAAILAGGASPATTATALKISLTTLRRWMDDARWPDLYEAARQRVVAEGGTEALLVLRSLLRSPSEAVRSQAARALATAAARTRESASHTTRRRPGHRLQDRVWNQDDTDTDADTAELAEAVALLRGLRQAAGRNWDEFGRDCDARIATLIESDPAAARRLLREWSQTLQRIGSGDGTSNDKPTPPTVTSARTGRQPQPAPRRVESGPEPDQPEA